MAANTGKRYYEPGFGTILFGLFLIPMIGLAITSPTKEQAAKRDSCLKEVHVQYETCVLNDGLNCGTKNSVLSQRCYDNNR